MQPSPRSLRATVATVAVVVTVASVACSRSPTTDSLEPSPAERYLDDHIAKQRLEIARRDKDRAALRTIIVSKPQFYFHAETNSTWFEKRIEFTISNGWSEALRSVTFRAVLAEAGRTIPWVDRELEIQIGGGLEPGETKTVIRAVDNWQTPLNPDKLQLSLSLVAAVGASTTVHADPVR